jgi:hypothetical protein
MGDKVIWDIPKLHEWDKNPRSISKEGYERLKKQISKLGMYKPLIVTPEGEVLGGNMRLKAYRELGIKDVWVSIVEPKTEADKLEYALSDNDRAGYYDDDLLANLIPEYPEFDWASYSVDLKEPTNLQDLLDQFTPDILDEIGLPNGDKHGFEQMTFTLSTKQAETVKEAIGKAKKLEVFDQLENENSNGNALFSVCKKYVGD